MRSIPMLISFRKCSLVAESPSSREFPGPGFLLGFQRKPRREVVEPEAAAHGDEVGVIVEITIAGIQDKLVFSASQPARQRRMGESFLQHSGGVHVDAEVGERYAFVLVQIPEKIALDVEPVGGISLPGKADGRGSLVFPEGLAFRVFSAVLVMVAVILGFVNFVVIVALADVSREVDQVGVVALPFDLESVPDADVGAGRQAGFRTEGRVAEDLALRLY